MKTNCLTLLRISFQPRIEEENIDVILHKKMKIFFLDSGGARAVKLRPFDSESKTASGCSNSLISKKNHP